LRFGQLGNPGGLVALSSKFVLGQPGVPRGLFRSSANWVIPGGRSPCRCATANVYTTGVRKCACEVHGSADWVIPGGRSHCISRYYRLVGSYTNPQAVQRPPPRVNMALAVCYPPRGCSLLSNGFRDIHNTTPLPEPVWRPQSRRRSGHVGDRGGTYRDVTRSSGRR
jgi:hypothetical protein